MLPDSVLVDLAARIERSSKRVERLETLEFGTAAFPSGGALTAICDFTTPSPLISFTFCTTVTSGFTIPGTFRHLFFICAYQSTLQAPSIPPKIEMTFNGDPGAVYMNYTRQEDPVGPPFVTDTEIPPIGFGTDTKISLPRASQNPVSIFVPGQYSSVFGLVPSYSRTGNVKSAAWWGQAHPITTVGANLMTDDQGGGEYRRFVPAPAPIITITLTHPPPGTFRVGSHFTLYGMP